MLPTSQLHRDLRQLRAGIDAALAGGLSDGELREHLEQLALKRAFSGFTWVWGPKLYDRNRVLFRPFILSHFGELEQKGKWRWERVRWRGAAGQALEAWLRRVDADDDVELFRRLYAWKLGETGNWKARETGWRKELQQRFTAAGSPARRALLLGKLDLWMALDEETALALYTADAKVAAPFILRHLRFLYSESARGLWQKVLAAARERRDEDFANRVYRRQVKVKDWQEDALALARKVSDAAELNETLEQRHPEGHSLDLGEAMFKLVEARGRDVLPYVRRHLRQVWSSWMPRSGHDKLLALAHDRGWLDLWAGLIVVCSRPKEYNRAIDGLLDNPRLPDAEIVARLRLLSGVSREWNFAGFGLAQVHTLEPDVALKLYERFPDLVRGPFKVHVSPSWWQPHDALLARAIERNDDVLADYLASRLLTRLRWGGNKLVKSAERAAAYYDGLKLDEQAFARRAAAVLTQVPAYSIAWYDKLVEENRLARLLFERSAAAFLSDAGAMRDLVEASEIHVQMLAYRVLGRDEERARVLARDNLPILIGTLLRPLHRATRMAALGALANAATTPEGAQRVLERARLAQALPDDHYPKEALLGLIGGILHAYPDLAGPGERPIVYRLHAA